MRRLQLALPPENATVPTPPLRPGAGEEPHASLDSVGSSCSMHCQAQPHYAQRRYQARCLKPSHRGVRGVTLLSLTRVGMRGAP